MKKLISILIISLIFISCKSSFVHRSYSQTSSASIEFTGNPTTGYTWLFSLSNNDVIEVSESVVYQGEDGRVGAPSVYTYNITPKKSGECEITFVYRRPWEEETGKEKTLHYVIEVKRDNSIVIKEKK